MTPLFETPLRDTSVCLAPDGFYYLTGTTGWPHWWTRNDGIRVWRSPDLARWEPLGLVFSIEEHGTWHREVDPHGMRAIWAPEIHHAPALSRKSVLCPACGIARYRAPYGP
jgi:beta-xylosidase